MASLLQQLGWHPTIGDPTIMGWFTVTAYFFTSAIALRLYFSAQQIFPEEIVLKQQRFWLIIAALLFFLGINKQLDLQSLLTAIGRYYAHQDGWYAQRRIVQVVVISGILTLLCGALLWFTIHFRTILGTNRLAIIGLIFLLTFIAIRATSFHHMDSLINARILNLRLNWILELSSIATIGFPALFHLLGTAKR